MKSIASWRSCRIFSTERSLRYAACVIGGKRSIPVGELRAVVLHVRELEAKSHRASRVSIWTYALLFVILLGSIRVGASSAYLSSSLQTNEESRMRTLQSLGVVSSIAIASVATAQNAVQWRVEDGGNGHWYAIVQSGQPFHTARIQAESIGGHLATITSAGEQDFVATSISAGTSFLNAWFGLYQEVGSVEPSGGWRWVTEEAFGPYANWWTGVHQPDNNACGGGIAEDFGMWAKQWGGTWADVTATAVSNAPCTGAQSHAIIEWSADCNSDGIVDFGQIQAGALVDADGNNIPDCCQSSQGCDSCPADVNGSGSVTGADLAAVLSLWGTDGGKFSRADVNGDGLINGADLAEVLNAWGACP